MANMTTLQKPVTEGQIGRLNEKVRARILKHATEIPSDVFQELLGDDSLINDIFTAVRKRIDAHVDMIIRTVKVNRNRPAKEALKATGRKLYVTDGVIKNMPKAEKDEDEVVFFKIGRQVSCSELDKEYALRGLDPADPYSQAAVNEADPAFADEHPNGTQWKDKDGNYCYAIFNRYGDERYVFVDRHDSVWSAYWWFAGVRKSTSNSDASASAV